MKFYKTVFFYLLDIFSKFLLKVVFYSQWLYKLFMNF